MSAQESPLLKRSVMENRKRYRDKPDKIGKQHGEPHWDRKCGISVGLTGLGDL